VREFGRLRGDSSTKGLGVGERLKCKCCEGACERGGEGGGGRERAAGEAVDGECTGGEEGRRGIGAVVAAKVGRDNGEAGVGETATEAVEVSDPKAPEPPTEAGREVDVAAEAHEDPEAPVVKNDVLEFPLVPLQPFFKAEFLKELNNPQEAEEFAEEDKKADLVVAQYGGPPSELSGSREEIERLKAEVQRLTDADAVLSRKVDNVDVGASAAVMDELTMELMATNEHLEKATAARMKAEMELAFVKEEAEDANALRAEVDSIRV
jgi:hypothetical protein